MLLPQKFAKVAGESTFAANAKSLRQFPQTGHSPRNGENQATNDRRADEADLQPKWLNSWFCTDAEVQLGQAAVTADASPGARFGRKGSPQSQPPNVGP